MQSTLKDESAANLPAATGSKPRCVDCRRSVDIRDPQKIVCSIHLDFRHPLTGPSCEHFERRQSTIRPPEIGPLTLPKGRK